jgi:hypothetical protein
MDIENDLNNEIEQLEYGANFLKARANSALLAVYGGEHPYDFEKEGALLGAAKSLEAADRLQGRANMLRTFGRDYDPAAFVDETEDA